MSAKNWMVDQPPASVNVQQISHMDHIKKVVRTIFTKNVSKHGNFGF